MPSMVWPVTGTAVNQHLMSGGHAAKSLYSLLLRLAVYTLNTKKTNSVISKQPLYLIGSFVLEFYIYKDFIDNKLKME